MTRLRLKLGFDNYSIRALNWKAPQLLDYAASLRLDTVLFSDLGVYESLSDGYLRGIRAKADDLGIEIHAGTGGICKASSFFNGTWGSPEQLLRTTIRVAKILGSPVARCFLGWVGDRPQLQARIDGVARTCRSVRTLAADSGVKIAIENHAGDMHSSELKQLIEAAGRDFVGATMDSGNAVWSLEDPHSNLQRLGRVALSTGIRDSAVWETEDGAAFEWTAMGEGQVDWKAYFDLYAKLCPRTPVQLEIITGPSRPLPYLTQEFWETWPRLSAADFSTYVAHARKGRPRKPYKTPKGLKAEQAWQRRQLEKSIRYCKEVIGLGLKK
jgi:sugar phosphate isomerase/epimerase